MPRSSLIPTLALALALVSAPSLEAQRVPQRGDWSIAAQLFNSDLGTVFGLWRMMTDRLNAGMEIDFRYGDSVEDVVSSVRIRGDATTWQFRLGPSVKLYGSRQGPVSPYLRAKAAVGWTGSKLTLSNTVARDEDGFNIQGSLALGAEWYPLRQLAIGGHTGFQWLHSSLDALENDGATTRKRETDTLGTFRSGLELHFFFR